MSERNKTMVALAVLAAAIGVYLEISYEQKAKDRAAKKELIVVPASSAATH